MSRSVTHASHAGGKVAARRPAVLAAALTAIVAVGAAVALPTAAGAGPSGAPRAQDADPIIHSVDPPEAYFRAWVTIRGSGFGTAAGRVTFAGPGDQRLRASTRAWSDASIEAEVPYNTVPGDVVVVTADGRASNGVRFGPPCWDRPVIRQILPASVMRCEVVRITGCGFGDFQYEQVLTFNGADATGAVIGNWSDTQLLVPVPDEATSGPVVVTNKRRVPSAGYPLRVRDDKPEWDRLPTIGRSKHAFALTLRVGEEPEQGPPTEIEVTREHWQSVNGGVQSPVELTATWRTATAFGQSGVDPGGLGTYTIDGTLDPVAGTLAVQHRDAWQRELWHNTSSGERKICSYELDFRVDLPIGSDVHGRPDFNVWAPRFGFESDGVDLSRLVRGLEYKQSCWIQVGGRPVRRDGTYELLGVDWTASSLAHVFEGSGRDPCREPDPRWDPRGEIRGRLYAPLAPSLSELLTGFADFTGLADLGREAPLPGAAVKLFVTPPDGPRQELAATAADADGRYLFARVPLTDTLDLEVTLANQAVAPVGFQVTYRRADGAPRVPVTLRTRPFSNVASPLLQRDVVFVDGAGISAVDAAHLDDVAVTYAHVAQAWQTAGALGLELGMHAAKGEPLEIRTFSPKNGTFWHGDSNVGPAYGRLAIPDNVFVNIEAAEAASGQRDRPMNREWHEMGHHIHADAQGDAMPQYWVSNAISNTNHSGRLNPSSADSWIEGFAEFFSTLVARHAARAPRPALYRMGTGVVNLDQNLTSFSVFGRDAAADEELAVASLLWDLVDSAGDASDVRPVGVNQTLLDAWGVRLDQPLAPADVRWPPTLYGDRIALDDRVLAFLIQEADTISAARPAVRSPNSPPQYGWVFDIHHLYELLKTMGVGQEAGTAGLTALDELFVAHGFYGDTQPQNLCYDAGERIGVTSNKRYTVTTPFGPSVVPAQADRHSPAPTVESYLRFDARDATTAATVDVRALRVEVDFDPPYDIYDYAYVAMPVEPGRLALVAPDPIYGATLRVTPLVDHMAAEAPFEVTGLAYWSAVASSGGPEVLRHTFTLKRVPHTILLPLTLRRAGATSGPPAVTAPTAGPPSSAAFAAELLALINAERERSGARALAAQGDLSRAAGWYASDMASSGDYRPDHSDRQGRTMPERMEAFGYGPDGHPRWHVAENMARGQTTPALVLAAWLASQRHRDNLLDRDACEIGVAHAFAPVDPYRHYWVADFGCRAARPTLPAIDGPGPGPTATGASPTAATPRTPGPTPSATREPTRDTATPVTPTTAVPATPAPTATLVPGLGIQGRVTDEGVGAADVLLVLVRITGSAEEQLATTTSGPDGRFTFTGAPTLGAGQTYYVRYPNNERDPSRVHAWFGPDIAAYRAGEAAHAGEFDIADVALLAPETGLTAWLPVRFEWQRRAAGNHTYRWFLCDEETGSCWSTADLGDRGEFVLGALPDGAAHYQPYTWHVRVYRSPDSFGLSYAERDIALAPGQGTPTTPTATPEALFHDDFCDPASGWPTITNANYAAGYVSDAGGCRYRVAVRTISYWARVQPGARAPGQEFTVTAPLSVAGAGAGGLTFGIADDDSSFYVFLASTDGSYGLYRRESGAWRAIVPPTRSDLVDMGWGNTLAVTSHAGSLELFIDGTRVATVADAGDHAGRVGLYAESHDQPATVEARSYDLD